MTYLHDFITARKALRTLIPKLLAGIIPILDREECTYEALWEGQPAFVESADSLIVRLPDGLLPNGYRLRIDFVPVNQVAWKNPDGTPTKGPGF